MSAPGNITYKSDPSDAGTRVDRMLAQRFPDYSRSQIQRAAEAGALLVNGTPVRSNHKVEVGDTIEVTLVRTDVNDFPPRAEKIDLDVIYEDDELLVINKAAGMVVHPAAGHRTGTLVNALLGRGAISDDEAESQIERPGIVHRLDKGTSGLMVIAKTELAHRRLAAQLKDRTLTRVYWALCWGRLKKSPLVIEELVGRSVRNRKKMTVTSKGREAVTTFSLIERFTIADWVEAVLGTGRTHQIRVHLAHAGHPVVGDVDYGGGEDHLKGVDPRWRLLGRGMLQRINRPALHARKISFAHPQNGSAMEFEVPLPADMLALIDYSRNMTV